MAVYWGATRVAQPSELTIHRHDTAGDAILG
jgi:hypothetical protein